MNEYFYMNRGNRVHGSPRTTNLTSGKGRGGRNPQLGMHIFIDELISKVYFSMRGSIYQPSSCQGRLSHKTPSQCHFETSSSSRGRAKKLSVESPKETLESEKNMEDKGSVVNNKEKPKQTFIFFSLFLLLLTKKTKQLKIY